MTIKARVCNACQSGANRKIELLISLLDISYVISSYFKQLRQPLYVLSHITVQHIDERHYPYPYGH